MNSKKYKQDNKTLKDQTRRDLTIKLLEVAGKHLTVKEQQVLADVLYSEKPFAQIGDELSLTGGRVKQIFQKAVRRLNHFVSAIDEKMEKYQELLEKCLEMEKRLAALEDKAKETQESESIWASLPVETQQILETHIDDTELSTRIKNACGAGNIHGESVKIVADLVKLSPNRLKTFRNFGQKSINEIEDFFSKNGLKWGMLK